MTTTDIWLASFLYRLTPSKLKGTSRDNKKIYYQFDYSKEEWDKLKIQFINSEESSIKYTLEKLKDLAFQ